MSISLYARPDRVHSLDMSAATAHPAFAPRLTVAALQLEVAGTVSELCEMEIAEVGRRAQAAGYSLAHRGDVVSLRTWLKHAAIGGSVYAVQLDGAA